MKLFVYRPDQAKYLQCRPDLCFDPRGKSAVEWMEENKRFEDTKHQHRYLTLLEDSKRKYPKHYIEGNW